MRLTGSVTLSLDGSVSNLIPGLTGTISNQFMQMFDLYLVEASTNLVDWERVALLPRTNYDPNPLLFQDTNAADSNRRFYRTFTNHMITPFPKPTGPFAVGTMDRVMVDPARTNRYRYSPASNAFMVTFWYPAEPPEAGVLPSRMWDPQFAADSTVFFYTDSRALYDSRWTKVFPLCVGHRFKDLPLAANAGRLPVVIYSHGNWASRLLDTQRAEELASHGYLVIAPDHGDCHASEFPDGRYLKGGSGDISGRLKDMTFLLGELTRLNQEDAFFRNRLDLERIGLYGHSYGGWIAETCRSDPRAKCAVLLDAYLTDNPARLQKPFLAITGPRSQLPQFHQQNERLFNQAVANAIWLDIKDADHFIFCDTAWGPLLPEGGRLSAVATACTLWFFDTYLKGETPPFPTNPEIINVMRK